MYGFAQPDQPISVALSTPERSRTGGRDDFHVRRSGPADLQISGYGGNVIGMGCSFDRVLVVSRRRVSRHGGGLVGGAGASAIAALVWMVVLSAASLYPANSAGSLWRRRLSLRP